jgi:cyanate permease
MMPPSPITIGAFVLFSMISLVAWMKEKKYRRERFETGKTVIRYSGWTIILFAGISGMVVSAIAMLMEVLVSL